MWALLNQRLRRRRSKNKHPNLNRRYTAFSNLRRSINNIKENNNGQLGHLAERQSKSPANVMPDDRNRGHSMGVSKRAVCWGLFFFLAASSLARGQGESAQDVQKSCRTFVQGFYDWYVRESDQPTVDASQLAVKQYAFSPELAGQLKEDWAAQAKDPGDIVGLDFDPFIGGNGGVLGRYVVGKITPKGDHYLVEISVTESGKTSEKPVVVAELTYKGGRWVFVNFHYGADGDLLGILKQLREERAKKP
jgi:hypothetical protein